MWFTPLLLLFPLITNAQRFVRFISNDGKEYTGDAILPPGTIDASKSKSARVIQGDILGDFTITSQTKVSLHKWSDVAVNSMLLYSRSRSCYRPYQVKG